MDTIIETKVSVKKAVEGLKKYIGNLPGLSGTTDPRGIGAIFVVNCFLENRGAGMLAQMADQKGELNLDAAKRNALEALEKLPGQLYKQDIPFIGTLELNKKAVDDIYNTIKSMPAGK